MSALNNSDPAAEVAYYGTDFVRGIKAEGMKEQMKNDLLTQAHKLGETLDYNPAEFSKLMLQKVAETDTDTIAAVSFLVEDILVSKGEDELFDTMFKDIDLEPGTVGYKVANEFIEHHVS